jgi:uncharacterized RDD family membrane protein YckC
MAMEPGWYPDPFSSGGYVRWWDGERWGASTSVGTTAPSAQPPGAPVPLPPPPPAMPPPPGYPASGYPGTGYAAAPDPRLAGIALAPWVSRAAARLIDSFIEGLIALPFLLWLVWPAVQRFVESVPSDGSAPSQEAMTALQVDLLSVSTWITVISVVISALYQLPQNKAWGRTLGKRALGIRIRPLAADVPLSWGQVIARWGVFEAFSIVLGGLPLLLDCLWPLWDKPWQQALHDKAAKTIVVRSR